MNGEIKFLIVSDLHLGIRESPVQEEIRVRTFQKIISLAAEYDMLLIAGDLLENAGDDGRTLRMAGEEFNRLADQGVRTFYCTGVSELSDDSEVLKALSEMNITHLFRPDGANAPFLFEKEDQMVHIYGVPAGVNPYEAGISRVPENGFHLGLFYVDFNPDIEYRDPRAHGRNIYTMKREDFKNLGLDFYAMGFNHNFRMFKVQDKIIAAYPGTPEATSFLETGDRYILSCSVTGNEIQSIKRLAVNSITIETSEFDCSLYSSFAEILAEIESMKSKKTHLSVILKGERKYPVNLSYFRGIKDSFHLLNVTDISLPTMDFMIREYGYEETLRGELLRIVRDKIQDSGVPADIQSADVLQIINQMIHGSEESLEDWLCSI